MRLAGLALLALSGCVHAQARVDYFIEGRVLDAATGAPVYGARVRWSGPEGQRGEEASSWSSDAVTDGDGRYRLSCPARVSAVYGLGYDRPLQLGPTAAVGALWVSCPRCRATQVELAAAPSVLRTQADGALTVSVQAPDVALIASVPSAADTAAER